MGAKMPNPARELVAILDAWRDDEAPKEQDARRITGVDEASLNNLRRHGLALNFIAACSSSMDELERRSVDVSHIRAHEVTWYRMVLSFPNGWSATGNRVQAYKSNALDALRSLAGYLDMAGPTVTQGQIDQVPDLLDEVERLLATDKTLPDLLRRHLHKLVQECRNALTDYEVLGVFDLSEALTRLWVGVNAAAEASGDADQKRGWRSVVARYTPQAAIGLLIEAPGVIAQLAGS